MLSDIHRCVTLCFLRTLPAVLPLDFVFLQFFCSFQGTIMSLAALTQPDIAEMVEAAGLLSPISYLDHITSKFVLRMVNMHLDQVIFFLVLLL